MATNKTQFDVEADVNVAIGKVTTKGVIPKIKKKLSETLKKVKTIQAPISISLSKAKISTVGLVPNIRSAVKSAISKAAAIEAPIKLSFSRVRLDTSGLVAVVRAKVKKLFDRARPIAISIKLSASLQNIIKQLDILTGRLSKVARANKDYSRSAAVATQATAKQATATRGLSGELGASLRVLFRYTILFQIFRTITAAIGAAVKSVIDLQDALISIQAIANLTATQMVKVESAIKNVATTTRFTTTEIAQAAQVLAQAGVSAEKIASTLTAVANFASATNATLQVSADIISTFQNVFNQLTVEDIADKLTNAVNISKLTPTGIQTIVSRLLQVTKAYNIAADQVLGAISTLRNVGIKDSTVSTGLRQAILELLAPDAKTLKVLEKRYEAIGQSLTQSAIKTLFTGFAEEDNPLLAVINELEKLGIQGTGAQDFQRVFDIRAQNVINALIENKKQFLENTEAINRTGSAAKAAATQLNSAKNAFSNLGAVISAIASDFGGPIVDQFANITNAATKALKSFREFLKTTGGQAFSRGVGNVSLDTAAAAGGPLGVIVKTFLLVTKTRKDVEKELELQAKTLAEGVEKAKSAVTLARSDLEAAGKFKENIETALETAAQAREAVGDVLGGGLSNNAEAQALINKATSESKDVNSQSFKNFVTNIAQVLGVQEEALNPAELAGALQEAQDSIDKAQSVRLELARKFQVALESTDRTDVDSQQVVKAFTELTSEQRTLLFSNINTLQQATNFLKTAPRELVGIEGLDRKLDEENKKLLEQQDLAFQGILKSAAQGTPASVNKLRASLQRDVAQGQTLFIEKYFTQLSKLIAPQDLNDLLQAANKNADLVFKQSLESFQKRVQATIPEEEEEELPFQQALLKNKEKLERERADESEADLRVEQFRVDLAALQAEAFQLVKDSNEKLKQFGSSAEDAQKKQDFIAEVKKEQVEIEKKIANTQKKIASNTDQTLSFEDQFAQAERNTIVTKAEIAELEDNLKKAKSAQLQDVEEQVRLTKEIAIAQKKQLVIQEDIIKKELDRLAEEAGFGDTSGLTTQQFIDAFSDPANQEVLKINKELGVVLKKAVETRAALNDVEEDLVRDLDNIRRKSLQSNLKVAERLARTATSKTQKSETALNTATTKLAAARDKLSKLLLKQSELKTFFSDAKRRVSGKGLKKDDVEDTLKAAKKAADPKERLELTKKAVSQAESLSSSGRISKGSAEDLIEDAEKIGLQAQSQIVDQQRQVVEALEQQRRELQEQTQEAIKSEAALKESVDLLKTSIDNLAGQVGKEAGKTLESINSIDAKTPDFAAGAPKAPETAQKQAAPATISTLAEQREASTPQPVEVVSDTTPKKEPKRVGNSFSFAEGGLVKGPGTTTSDSIDGKLSKTEFVQPADATKFYGVDFMEKLRKMEIPIEQVRAITAPDSKDLSVSNKLLDSLVQGSGSTPVSFTFEGSSINAKADPKDIQGFKRQLALEALKSGKRFN